MTSIVAWCLFTICTPEMKCMKKSVYADGFFISEIVVNNLIIGNSVRVQCEPKEKK